LDKLYSYYRISFREEALGDLKAGAKEMARHRVG